MPEHDERPWFQRFFEAIPPGWAAGLIIALVGGGAIAHNSEQIGQEQQVRHQLRHRVDSLIVVTRRLELRIARVERHSGRGKGLQDVNEGRQATPNPIAGFFGRIFSIFSVPPQDRP